MTLNSKFKQLKTEIFWSEEDKMFIARPLDSDLYKSISALGHSPFGALAELYVVYDALDMDAKVKEENKSS